MSRTASASADDLVYEQHSHAAGDVSSTELGVLLPGEPNQRFLALFSRPRARVKCLWHVSACSLRGACGARASPRLRASASIITNMDAGLISIGVFEGNSLASFISRASLRDGCSILSNSCSLAASLHPTCPFADVGGCVSSHRNQRHRHQLAQRERERWVDYPKTPAGLLGRLFF